MAAGSLVTIGLLYMWFLYGFSVVSIWFHSAGHTAARHLLKQPRQRGYISSGTPWLVPVTVMSAVQGPSEHPARHAAAFSFTGCAVHSTQTLLTWMTIQMGAQSCPVWCPCLQDLSQGFSKPTNAWHPAGQACCCLRLKLTQLLPFYPQISKISPFLPLSLPECHDHRNEISKFLPCFFYQANSYSFFF